MIHLYESKMKINQSTRNQSQRGLELEAMLCLKMHELLRKTGHSDDRHIPAEQQHVTPTLLGRTHSFRDRRERGQKARGFNLNCAMCSDSYSPCFHLFSLTQNSQKPNIVTNVVNPTTFSKSLGGKKGTAIQKVRGRVKELANDWRINFNATSLKDKEAGRNRNTDRLSHTHAG